jgi:hypothetical protein
MKLFPLRLTTLVLGSLFLLNGSVTPSSVSPSGSSRGLRVPQSFTRMFDGQCFSAKIFILAPPFYPSPAPVAAIAQSCGNAIAFDPADGAFVVTSGAVFGKLSVNVYRPPYSSVSVPAVSFSPSALSHPRQVAWDGSGNVWLSDDAANRVYEFRAPFSPSSVPAAENALATQPVGLAIDPEAGLMFVGDVGGSSACAKTSCRVDVVRAPYTGAPVVTLALGDSTPAALAVDEMGRLFVGFESGSSKGLIKVYVPPFATGESAAYTLDAGGPINSLAFDSNQNLYAQLHDTGGVVVFDGPISGSASTPSASLGCPHGVAKCELKNWAGLAFGP